MCGITAKISIEEHGVRRDLLRSLKRLEYRGYDSVGFATNNGVFSKSTSPMSEFISEVDEDVKSFVSISHTRWATHGGVTHVNAHPHFDSTKTVFVVHNGIIENYDEIREELERKGYDFVTETDSEVIPFFFYDEMIKNKKSFGEAAKEFIKRARGTFAIILTIKNDDKLYALKRDSPLALGILDDGFMLASDIFAFSDETNKAIFFEDDTYAEIKKNAYSFYDSNGDVQSTEITVFDWGVEEEDVQDYPHFMIKEIHEQPKTSKRLINSLETEQKKELSKIKDLIGEAKRVVFVASGTSYHASLIGVHLLNRRGVESHAVIASEFESFYLVDDKTLIIAVSQSGETMDVVTVIKKAKEEGAKIVSVVNVPYSTIQRHSDVSLEIRAGQEVCVASTKTFTNQLITLFFIAKLFSYKEDLSLIPDKIKKTLEDNEDKVKVYAKKLYKKKDVFVLGKGATYPIAREIALKLKEIPYVHAEGMMAGELKHGTIALVEKDTPIICLIPKNNPSMLSSAKEVEARGAEVIVISNDKSNKEVDFLVPESDDAQFSIYSTMIGHLLSYYIGVLRGVSIDKPRNLAKSVTVH
ncbi:glutamine--fructose-6-phosphate transaminase (isomerizing) [Candidatus Woesearchaeota archaeon]|nr:glutamine--fructose-6-phosphate transaminase (isomerizing) [Candidatus Woesearchaeota archaeon]